MTSVSMVLKAVFGEIEGGGVTDFQGVLFLTHSSRLTLSRFCSREFLTRRFADPNRLKHLPPFENLPPLKPHRFGAVSFYRVTRDDDGGAFDMAPMGTLKRAHRIQFVVALDGRNLLVGYETYLEHWRFHVPLASLVKVRDMDFDVARVISHPLMAGVRSIQPLDDRRVVVACSALDGILILDWRTGQVEKVLRLPFDQYGFNYDLGPKTDLRLHYISNNRQTSHLNAAWPLPGGKEVLVSTFIQGAIGAFSLETGEFREVTSGFIGCNGVRVNGEGHTYFTDRGNGALVFLGEYGSVMRRFEIGSKWLGDAVHIGGNCYVFSLADSNELHFYDIQTGACRFRQSFMTCPHPLLAPLYWWMPGWIGNSTMFLSYAPASTLKSAGSRPVQ